MASLVKTSVTTVPADLSAVPQTHLVRKELTPDSCPLTAMHVFCFIHTHELVKTYNIFMVCYCNYSFNPLIY